MLDLRKLTVALLPLVLAVPAAAQDRTMQVSICADYRMWRAGESEEPITSENFFSIEQLANETVMTVEGPEGLTGLQLVRAGAEVRPPFPTHGISLFVWAPAGGRVQAFNEAGALVADDILLEEEGRGWVEVSFSTTGLRNRMAVLRITGTEDAPPVLRNVCTGVDLVQR